MARSTYLSIITFKCQLSKRSDQKTEWLTELKKKLDQELTIFCLLETHFIAKYTHRLKVKGWKRYFMQMEMIRK